MRRFQEDPLRVLRAAQFLARLEFTIAPESERLVHEMVARGDLAELPRKRVTDEIEKLLFKPARPSVGFDFLRRNKIVEAVFPESTVQDWEGWKQRIDATAATCQDHAVMLAAFLSGFTSSDRERVAISLEFKDNKNLAACALALLRESDRVESSPTNPANDARKTLRRIGPASPESYATWLLILGRREEGERFVSLVRENNLDARDLLRGRDLIDLFHLSPGPKFRQVLKAVESARDEGKINTRDEAIDLIRSSLMIF
jgi:tRNA nucleotidyltransferase/poly(A) polymerase